MDDAGRQRSVGNGWNIASRLPDYFTEEHCEQEIDAKSLRRVYFWLDSNAIYQGGLRAYPSEIGGRRDRCATDGPGRADGSNKNSCPSTTQNAECHKNLLAAIAI